MVQASSHRCADCRCQQRPS